MIAKFKGRREEPRLVRFLGGPSELVLQFAVGPPCDTLSLSHGKSDSECSVPYVGSSTSRTNTECHSLYHYILFFFLFFLVF